MQGTDKGVAWFSSSFCQIPRGVDFALKLVRNPSRVLELSSLNLCLKGLASGMVQGQGLGWSRGPDQQVLE